MWECSALSSLHAPLHFVRPLVRGHARTRAAEVQFCISNSTAYVLLSCLHFYRRGVCILRGAAIDGLT